MRIITALAAVALTAHAATAETPRTTFSETTNVASSSPDERSWAVTVYLGPAASKYVGAILQDFNMQSRELMVGVALDRNLLEIWTDFYIAGEVQISQYFMGHSNTVFSTMIGFQAEKLLGFERTSFAFYTGPSYALNPPYTVIGYKHRIYRPWRKKFLNAIAIEFASGLPFTENWDWNLRAYHRSGVFGLYSDGNDDGLSLGLGVKYHF